MPAFINLTGKRFGKLLVISLSTNTGNGGKPVTYWKCKCDCGNTHVVTGSSLKSSRTRSCGCNKDAHKEKHRRCFTKEYNSWQSMKKRCAGVDKKYDRYFLKGITVCPEWIDDFKRFYADMGSAPSAKHTIDRIDNSKGYYKGNCRWATYTQQNRNRKTRREFTLHGRTMSVSEWAEFYNIDVLMLYNRLQKGWDFNRAVFTPKRHY